MQRWLYRRLSVFLLYSHLRLACRNHRKQGRTTKQPFRRKKIALWTAKITISFSKLSASLLPEYLTIRLKYTWWPCKLTCTEDHILCISQFLQCSDDQWSMPKKGNWRTALLVPRCTNSIQIRKTENSQNLRLFGRTCVGQVHVFLEKTHLDHCPHRWSTIIIHPVFQSLLCPWTSNHFTLHHHHHHHHHHQPYLPFKSSECPSEITGEYREQPARWCPFGKNRCGPVWYTIYHQLPVVIRASFKPLYFHQPTNGNLGHQWWEKDWEHMIRSHRTGTSHDFPMTIPWSSHNYWSLPWWPPELRHGQPMH